MEWLSDLGVEEIAGVRPAVSAGWSRSDERRAAPASATTRTGSRTGGGSCWAASRSRTRRAASPATPTPTCSPTRSSTPCSAPPGLGDIGQHFPDTDERWRDADSLDLLRAVVAAARRRRSCRHIDATVVCEAPSSARTATRCARAWPTRSGWPPARERQVHDRRGDGLRGPRRGRRGARDRHRAAAGIAATFATSGCFEQRRSSLSRCRDWSSWLPRRAPRWRRDRHLGSPGGGVVRLRARACAGRQARGLCRCLPRGGERRAEHQRAFRHDPVHVREPRVRLVVPRPGRGRRQLHRLLRLRDRRPVPDHQVRRPRALGGRGPCVQRPAFVGGADGDWHPWAPSVLRSSSSCPARPRPVATSCTTSA